MLILQILESCNYLFHAHGLLSVNVAKVADYNEYEPIAIRLTIINDGCYQSAVVLESSPPLSVT